MTGVLEKKMTEFTMVDIIERKIRETAGYYMPVQKSLGKNKAINAMIDYILTII